MLIEMMIFALAVSVLSGGRMSQLGRLDLRRFWLVPLAFLLQIAVYWAAVNGFSLGRSWVSPVFDTISYFLLLIFTLCNWSVTGMRLLAFGILLNTLVIALNGGVMPVESTFLPDASRRALLEGQGTHGLMTSTTRISVLADRFYIAIPGLNKQVFSVGDIFIDIGSFLLVFKTMTRKRVSNEYGK